MSELVFYTNPQSRGRIVRWMLEEVGAPYATEILEYGTTMKSPEYLAINPMGKVPAIRHGETVVTECAAICAYLADAFPEAGLVPPPAERGAYYRWLFFAAGPLESAIVNAALGFEVPEDKRMTVGYGTKDHALDAIETAIADSPYVAGDAFSAADVYVGAQIAFGLQFGTVPKRDSFAAYVARATDREAYRRAVAIDDGVGEAGG
ncbi:glutathione S-transferase family protein [Lentisalinibacter sediminis]|uniref:glutathione S-transferase family protein n=1 Tax=Lentisalinibacter sediminis TaxID=2992237 RepID=UPI00386E1445